MCFSLLDNKSVRGIKVRGSSNSVNYLQKSDQWECQVADPAAARFAAAWSEGFCAPQPGYRLRLPGVVPVLSLLLVPPLRFAFCGWLGWG